MMPSEVIIDLRSFFTKALVSTQLFHIGKALHIAPWPQAKTFALFNTVKIAAQGIHTIMTEQ